MKLLRLRSLAVFLACASLIHAADFKAGVARVQITPPTPFWLSGYAARTNPAPRIRTDLWAKALALEDRTGGRAVIVTTDLIGLPAEISDTVARSLARDHRLPRAALVVNSSHTHAGPAIWPNLRVMFDFADSDQERVKQYALRLTDQLGQVAGDALKRLEPATLSFGRGQAGFAVNRRQPTPDGVRLGVNPDGPVDHSVPVLRVSRADGSLLAVLFGYACHNTTLGGDFYEVDGDYAGAAQRNLEREFPGATALFLMLCGGDQNPNPRGKIEHVEQYGRELADAVAAALRKELVQIRPPIRAAHQTARLDFAPHTRETFEAELQDANLFRQRRARLMLEAYDRGQPVRQLDLPVQALRLGRGLTLLALGGEVVIDYGLRVQREFPAENVVVAAYCHDVACYIPSLRVLREGGYEAVDSMIYYGQPGPFAETVEESVFAAIREVMAKVKGD
ncbi:MAG: neutral/alkaline non-lysosomal ceramidase N-terminal domain-containing protein [Verrucomicrobia bacterium]|nr:neutral/alkaline non-lysosomal ceramidase N-terminal domain-containing protein [Verrucomicrobiota bacterium]